MKGLLLKDWYLTLRYQRAFLIIVIAFSIGNAAASESMSLFLTFYPCLMAGLMVPSLLAYDEREKWHIYTQTLPVTRAQYVTGKYLFGLCVAVAMSALTGIVLLIAREGLSGLPVRFAACLLLQSLILPFVFRFGAEKGRLIYAVVAGLFAAGAVAGWMAVDLGGETMPIGGVPAAVASLAVCALSWRLSIALYNKREL